MQRRHPIALALLNLIELVFQLRGKLHIEKLWKTFDQQTIHRCTQFRGDEPAFLVLDIAPFT
jgi:hypothetical protein